MPQRAKQPCRFPGCVQLTDKAYCEKHAAERRARYEQERGSAAARGYDARWRRLRAMHLAQYPLCVDPFKDHAKTVVAATDVDHIIPKVRGGSDDDSNLQSLCHACHSKKTIKQDMQGAFKGM